MTTLGQRIRNTAGGQALSQEALARRMDVSRRRLPNGSRPERPSTENSSAWRSTGTVDLLRSAPIRGGGRSAAGSSTPVVPEPLASRVLAALAVTAGYLVFYLLGRILWCPLISSLLGLAAVGAASGEENYLCGWLLSGGLPGGPWPSPP